IRRASVAVVPSRWYENMPIAVLEAFAVGVPVVASNLGGLPELIGDRLGALVPPDDPRALADALQALTTDPNGAFEAGRAARALMIERYSPAVHLERLETVYREAGAGAPRRVAS